MLHFLEYWAARLALLSVDLLPPAAASRWAGWLGSLWWTADRPRRRVAISNVLRAGVAEDEADARAIGRAAARHMGMVLVESMKSSRVLDDPERLRARIPAEVQAVLEDPAQGLIVVSGHFGNWELAGQWLSRYKPVAGISRPMNNPRVERLARSRRPRRGFRMIPKYDPDSGRFLKLLGDGEILALLVDQHAHRGADVPFFDHPAKTHTTAAMLHLVARAPLTFAICRRTAPMTFELSLSPLIEQPRSGDRNADVEAILRTLNAHLEAAIRRDPDQYLWGHRRWR
ncbi:MAG: lysophospholipid acyltransferase family protein [Acidobacteria bacterium]|nr:lysophospholipid acyltransferase family protein [Acidobacteriota bacterium]MCY3966142.1 lysophospholipid acyltransferase family protein [Acidobacteriota bacterium]